MKIPGVVMVFVGGFSLFLQYSRTLRQEMSLIRDLISALELLESGIRWKKLPLPQGIRELSARKVSGKYFAQVSENMVGESTLQSAWNDIFSKFQPEIADILCAVEWSGDSQQIQGSLQYTAQQLMELYRSKESSLHQREKLCAAAALSGAGLLVIILI